MFIVHMYRYLLYLWASPYFWKAMAVVVNIFLVLVPLLVCFSIPCGSWWKFPRAGTASSSKFAQASGLFSNTKMLQINTASKPGFTIQIVSYRKPPTSKGILVKENNTKSKQIWITMLLAKMCYQKLAMTNLKIQWFIQALKKRLQETTWLTMLEVRDSSVQPSHVIIYFTKNEPLSSQGR